MGLQYFNPFIYLLIYDSSALKASGEPDEQLAKVELLDYLSKIVDFSICS